MPRRDPDILILILVALLITLLAIRVGNAATARTENFVVTAIDQVTADGLAQACEHYRAELARKWSGKLLAPWDSPALIEVTVDNSSGGGTTSIWIQAGRVTNIQGRWQGTRQKLIDDVVPHEVLHCVFLSALGTGNVPLWINEGVAVTAESPAERSRSTGRIIRALHTRPNPCFTMAELMSQVNYPQRADRVRLFYDQSHSLISFLLEKGGRPKLLNTIDAGIRSDKLLDGPLAAWQRTLAGAYGFRDIAHLQNDWLSWLRQGGQTNHCVGLRRLMWNWRQRSAAGPHWHQGQQCPT